MTNANIYMSRLNRTRFISCQLKGADLRRAKLRKAWLVGSDLTDARLDRTHFDQTWLSGSKLLNVDFDQIDLRNSIVYEVAIARKQQRALLGAIRIRTNEVG
jgi:uncharacterized protein YjbI with pentapeptide repeats